jgi:hypothetical protein
MMLFAGKVAIGSTGAVGTQTGKGFAVTRTGTGLYTITLTGTGGTASILYADVRIVPAAANNTQSAYVLTHGASTRTVTIQCNDAGTVDVAADPPSGSILSFFLVAASQ